MLRVNLKLLRLFDVPMSVWDIHKVTGKSYGYLHLQTQKLRHLKLIEEKAKVPSKNNPKILAIKYSLTEKGKKLLAIFP